MCTRIGGTFFTFPEGQLLCFFGISVHEISKTKCFSCLLPNVSDDDDDDDDDVLPCFTYYPQDSPLSSIYLETKISIWPLPSNGTKELRPG